MTWQLIHLADVPATPWRNGGGRTRELVAWPRADAWDWRISVAEVGSSGPFSRFDGVRRWLAILRGAGVRLDFAGGSIDLAAHGAPLAFDGAEPVECALLAGAVQDLNLMVRSGGGVSAGLSRMLRITGNMGLRIDSPGTVALYASAAPAIVCINGVDCAVPPETLAWRKLSGTAEIRVQAEAALWMEIAA